MSESVDLRGEITNALAAFEKSDLSGAASHLFEVLGYRSDRTLAIQDVAQFIEAFDPENRVNATERAALDRLTSLRFLFQLTDTELTSQSDLLSDSGTVENTRIHSYLFFAAELPPGHYTRTVLSTLVRAINKPLLMPALILFRHGATVSIGIIHRRLHKRDQAKDVLEKVTLIKDIDYADPIRAHQEILNDFVLDNLDADFGTSNFISLHNAWQKRLGSYALSNDFYREIADWYFWAHHQVDDGTIELPRHCDTEEEKSLFLIRLLTRLIFCWFLVEKRLLPPDLFRRRNLENLLSDFSKEAHTYYQAVLQNLFFGTLNMPIEQRGFREKKKNGARYDKNRGITNLWRYGLLFRDYDKAKDVSPAWVALAAKVPFLNGGLFDCLDDKTGKKPNNSILDGFSDNPNESCHLPNDLFFGAKRTVDLSRDYGEEDKRTARSKRAKVRGLIEILARYKFTIEENTPLEEEIALDPELLGKVFENLLASYNEDTRTTARKALGAFYTPREIVSYMVDEALRSYLATQVPAVPEKALRDLFSAKATPPQIKPAQREALVAAIGRVKILDPACGSGAFPMGALHRLVDLLQKLDPNNESWKRDRLAEARRYRELLEEAGADKDEIADCDSRIADIEKSFNTRFHALDFARKLYLIENCIYGVDIQPIATQIAKLRFFISLIVDQKVETTAPNLGVRPLPNLETRLVAADALIPIDKQSDRASGDLFSGNIDRFRADLARIRHEHFNARDPRKKAKWRADDAAKREELAELLRSEHGLPKAAARKLAAWDPYDQNDHAPFFDTEWMFGIPVGKIRLEGKSPVTLRGNLALINEVGGQAEFVANKVIEIDSGFDVVIGNPPYVLIQGGLRDDALLELLKQIYEVASYKIDLYHLFIERGIKCLKQNGCLAYITPSNFATNNYCETLRRYLLKNCRLDRFVSFEDNVFHASVNNWVFQVTRGGQSNGTGVAFYQGQIADGKLFLENIATVPQTVLSSGEGLFVPPTSSKAGVVVEQIERAPRTLNQLATVNFGMQLRDRKEFSEDVVKGWPNPETLTKFHKPCVTGRDIRRFSVRYDGMYCYFNREAKRGGCWDDDIHNAANKVIVRQIGEFPEGGIDLKGYAVLNTAFMILPREGFDVPLLARFLLAIINSSSTRFFWTNRFRDDRKTFPKIKGEYLKLIPIPKADTGSQQFIARIVDLVTYGTMTLAADSVGQNTRDPLMLAYFEQILNGLVYELYFPDEVHGAGLRLFDLVEAANLPALDAMPEAQRLPRLRQLFETLHDGTHPLKIALQKLQTLDTIRIIEGKA